MSRIVSHSSRPGPKHQESRGSHVEAVLIFHEGVMQQVPVDLGLDEDQVDEQDDEVVLNIFIAEAPTVPTHGEPYVVPAGFVAGAGILCPERPDRMPALDTDGHDRFL